MNPRSVAEHLEKAAGEHAVNGGSYGLSKAHVLLLSGGKFASEAAAIVAKLLEAQRVDVIAGLFNSGEFNVNNACEYNLAILRQRWQVFMKDHTQ